jgi:acyl carrier protein
MSFTPSTSGQIDRAEIQREVRAFLLEHSAAPNPGELGNQDSLLEMGILDSLAMLDLIAHLEGRYGVTVGEDEMTPENFDSIDAIVDFLGHKAA